MAHRKRVSKRRWIARWHLGRWIPFQIIDCLRLGKRFRPFIYHPNVDVDAIRKAGGPPYVR